MIDLTHAPLRGCWLDPCPQPRSEHNSNTNGPQGTSNLHPVCTFLFEEDVLVSTTEAWELLGPPALGAVGLIQYKHIYQAIHSGVNNTTAAASLITKKNALAHVIRSQVSHSTTNASYLVLTCHTLGQQHPDQHVHAFCPKRWERYTYFNVPISPFPVPRRSQCSLP